MSLSPCMTPANTDEGAQVTPGLDAMHTRTGRPGRPWKRLKVIPTDKMPHT